MISLVVGFASLFTGLIFTLILTRQLSQNEFGTWGLIGSLIAYTLIFQPIISFWNTRETARGEESAKTAIVSSGFFITLAVFVYFVISLFFGEQTDADYNILLIAGILVPVDFFRRILVGINLGYKPQTEEYGFLAFEVTKVIGALIFLYYLDLGILGLLIAVFLAHIVDIIVLIIRSYEKLKGTFKKNYLKKWLKFFWLPTYPHISSILTTSDIVIFTAITGSVMGVAYWSAALTVSRLVHHASKVSKAIYPKLLESGKKEYFQENIHQVFYFAFPLAAISLVFSRPALFALNPIYEIANSIVIFVVITIFLRTLNELFSHALQGLEKVDLKSSATFRDYLKSKLFYLPTLRNIQRGGYLALLAIVLLSVTTNSGIDLVMLWAIIALICQIPYTIYLYVLIRKEIHPNFNLKRISKYLLISILVFGFLYVFVEQYLEYKISIFEFLPNLFGFIIIGALAYMGITYAIDSNTRKLFKAVINEIKKKPKK